jgi:hypothetical protein
MLGLSALGCSDGGNAKNASTTPENADAGGGGADVGSDAAWGAGASDGAGSVVIDASPNADPDIAYSVTLTMDTFTVQPGGEVYMCQDFANPFNGVQADIKTYELHMAQGSHHMFAFYEPNAANTSVTKCPQGGLQFQPFTFVAQSKDVVQTFPEGVGATIPPTTGFTLNVHYLNPQPTPITSQVVLTMYVAKPGVITQHAGVLFLNQGLLVVPPTDQPSTSTSTFTLPQDVNVLSSGSHMHQRATAFTATASTGETLFQTDQWAEPMPKPYAPPLMLTAGTTISWSCTYVNDTGATLTFGESAQTNVMCISISTIYPVADVTNPVIAQQF